MNANPVIIASGGANLASLCFAVERLGRQAIVTQDPGVIADATHVFLPGVGAARDAMDRLRSAGLTDVIPGLTQPVLGICLGMQLLFEGSEEDEARCLGIIPGTAKKFDYADGRPVPQMGWNKLEMDTNNPLVQALPEESYCYFVHSYALPIDAYTIAEATYGEPFTAAVAKNNFFGTQFHPERSGSVGRQILKNFLSL